MKKPKCILALSIRDQKTLFLTCSHLICFGSPCKLFKNSRRSKVLTRYTNETFIANGFTWFEFLNDFKWTFWSHILSNLGNELTILQKVKIHYNFEIIFSKLKSLVPVRFYSYDFWRHSAPLHSETKIELLGSKDPRTCAIFEFVIHLIQIPTSV